MIRHLLLDEIEDKVEYFIRILLSVSYSTMTEYTQNDTIFLSIQFKGDMMHTADGVTVEAAQ